MNKLDKMLFREIFKHRSQFLAAAAVIFVGITIFAAANTSYRNLNTSLEQYYRLYSFLDYYAEARQITPQAVKDVQVLGGVREAMGRLSYDVAADMGEKRKVTVRLISVPDGKRPAINDVYLIAGSYLSPDREMTCLLEQKFAKHHGLGKGDTLKVVINSKTVELRVEGTVASPEYIYAIKSAAAAFPIEGDFGVVYVKDTTARNLFGSKDAYNQLHVTLDRGADSKVVMDRIEDTLKPYGFIYGTERADQLSHSTVSNEIKELEEMSYMFPALFLIVAAMMIYITQRRIINNQRTLIGIMKGLGYSKNRIFGHYLKYSLLVSVAGTIPAILAGLYLSKLTTRAYNSIFSIPVQQLGFYWDVFLVGIAISVGFCLLAGYNAAKSVLAIQPSQAMRPEAPRAGKRIFLERFTRIWSKVSFGWKMSIRNIFRAPQRTILTMLGIMVTIMFFMVSMFMADCVDYVFKQHFTEFQQYDYKVQFAQSASVYDAYELDRIKGISKAEPILEVPVEIKKGWMKEETITVGLTEKSRFYRLTDEKLRPIEAPSRGILLAQALADKLAVKPGDTVMVKPYLGSVEEKNIKVAGLVKQYLGFNCFMNMEEMGELLGEGKFATGALISVERGSDELVKKELFKVPGVETLESRSAAHEAALEMQRFMRIFINFMLFFGTVMGFAIIFNTTIINIMERTRELASLRVLGYTKNEVEKTILRENILVGLVAVLPGIILGRIVSEYFAGHFSNKLVALEVIIYPRTYLLTLGSVFIFIGLAQWACRRNISGLDLVEVLKDREV